MESFFVFSYIPLLLLGLIVWAGLRGHKNYGKRPRFLLYSLITLVPLYILFNLYLRQPEQSSLFPRIVLVLLSFFFYHLAFFFLEYSIHYQRIFYSYLTEEVKPSLQRIRFWTLISLIPMALYALNGQMGWFFPDPQKNVIILELSLVPFIILNIQMMSRVFVFKRGVLRKKNYPFIYQFIFLLYYALIFMVIHFMEKITFTPFLVLNLVYAVRLYEEYLHHRTQHMSKMLEAQKKSRLYSTQLINHIITSPQEEDGHIIGELIHKRIEQTQDELINENYGISGLIAYRLFDGEFRVSYDEMIWGYCTPLSKVENIKKLRQDNIHKIILEEGFSLSHIQNSTEDELDNFGAKYIKKMLDSGEMQEVAIIPEYYQDQQKMILFVPIVNDEQISSFLVVYKDGYPRLYPHEKNMLINLGYDLNTLFSINYGKHIQQEKNRLDGEMNIAKEIQTSIVPAQMELPGYSIACSMETATEVGGDAYEFIPTEQGNYFAIGDVSGHGLPSGIMALIFMSGLQSAVETALALGKELDPVNAYDIVNRVLCTINRDRIVSDKFMTGNVFLEKEGTFHHAGTHEIALIYRKASDSVDPVMGCVDGTAFLGLSEMINSSQSKGEFVLNSGDVLLLYTDGMIEAKDKNSIQYGVEKLAEFLQSNHNDTPQELIDGLMEDVYNYARRGDMEKHNGSLADDVSLVIIKKE